jgi:hypothetical protein
MSDVKNRELALARAVSILLLQDTRYYLSYPYNGGTNPGAPHPAAPHPTMGLTLDCTGFACWSAGFSRHRGDFVEYGGDINTTSMIKDADNTQSVFSRIKDPIPGCFIVVPGRYTLGVRIRPGHVGVVYRTSRKYGIAIDCSGSNRPSAISFSPFDKWGENPVFLDWKPGVVK